jgi:hypothetical protein
VALGLRHLEELEARGSIALCDSDGMPTRYMRRPKLRERSGRRGAAAITRESRSERIIGHLNELRAREAIAASAR